MSLLLKTTKLASINSYCLHFVSQHVSFWQRCLLFRDWSCKSNSLRKEWITASRVVMFTKWFWGGNGTMLWCNAPVYSHDLQKILQKNKIMKWMAKRFWYFYYVSRRTNWDKTTSSCFLVTTGYSASLIWQSFTLNGCPGATLKNSNLLVVK